MRRVLWSISAVCMLAAALLQFGGTGATVGADPITKTVSGTCTGADAATNGLLAALGGTSLAVKFKVDGDVPKSLTPNQTGANASFTWSITLDPSLVAKAAATGVKQLTVRKTVLDISVSGPTSTQVVQGRPADAVLVLNPAVAATLVRGPFTAPLANVGESGVISYRTTAVTFTISVALAGRAIDLNIACSAPALVGSSPIKVAGAPEISPVEVKGTPGAAVPIDVLATAVKAGKTPVVPSSLRAVDPAGKVVDGKLVVTAGKAGSVTSAAFEVCGQPIKVADAVPGVSEVQRLTLDTNLDAFKRSIGFSLKYGEEETKPIWTAELGFFGFLGGLQLGATFPPAASWPDLANNYAIGTSYLAPSADTVKAALEALPSVGAGNVTVVRPVPTAPTYDITFKGALAEKDVEEITLGRYLSVLPQENLDALIALAGSLGGGGGGTGGEGGGEGGATTTTSTTVPEGLTVQQYIDRLLAEAGDLVAAGDFDSAGNKLSEALRLSLSNALANIDVQQTVAAITALFPAKPVVATTTPGTEPIAEQFQDLCAQGAATVVVPAATVTTVPSAPTTTAAPAPPAPPAPGVLSEQANRSSSTGGSSVTATGPTALADTGAAPAGLLVAGLLLLVGGLVVGDVSRATRRR